jgi:hypothetical protein
MVLKDFFLLLLCDYKRYDFVACPTQQRGANFIPIDPDRWSLTASGRENLPGHSFASIFAPFP